MQQNTNPEDVENTKEEAGFSVRHDHRISSDEYFKKLRVRLKTGLLAALLTPLAVLSIYFHLQFNSTLKETGKLHLISLAESQRNTIDLFLQERVVNIFGLFRSLEFNLAPSPQEVERYLQNLRQVSDAFIDVGFLNSAGLQIGYAGPFPFLHGRDYSQEDWFVRLMAQERNYYISDIYLGFRNKPHFTIAVRQRIDGAPYVMRATLDPDKFYVFLRNLSQGKGIDSALVNDQGDYQLVDPQQGELLGKSEYLPATAGSDVDEIRINGDSILVACARLTETPWAMIVRQPMRAAYAQMYRTRQIMIVVTFVIIVALGLSIWLLTDLMLKRAQLTADAREELKTDLIHASKLASIGELAAGIAHEINNPLATISATSGVIRDLFDPQFQLEWDPETIREELTNIDTAVLKAQGITQKLLKFSRKNTPRLAPTSVNRILDDVVKGLKEREFQVSNIQLARDYDQDLPLLMLDADQLGQVFLNIINNAGDAIDGSGVITLSTRRNRESIRVTVTDSGAGMTTETMQKIFLPFYATKDVGKGTGLGLSVSQGIVESMGGSIEVQSMPGAGSAFTVVLPITEIKGAANGSS